MSNYPDGMSRSDLIHVGEIDGGERILCNTCSVSYEDHRETCENCFGIGCPTCEGEGCKYTSLDPDYT